MSGIIEVTTTVETVEQAETIGRHLVERKLAACVQVTGPIQSIYRWQGEICQAAEYRCTIKTSDQLQAQVMDAVRESHPYEVPEILVTDVKACSEAYADWLHGQLQA